MKVYHTPGYSLNKRKGAMVIMLVMSIGSASFLTANKFATDRMTDYKIARAEADGFRAQMLARSGFQGALGALKKVPEEVLYMSGLALNPPPIPLGGGKIYYKMEPEDGKFNINSLVKYYDQQPSTRAQEMLTRLFEQLGIKRDKIFPIIDWIDENSQEMGGGAEIYYYSGLKPPRKIKNGPFYNLSELLSVKGFNRKLLYESSKPPDLVNTKSTSFMSEEERLLLSDKDYVLANNITAYLPFKDTSDERINLNSAPYHVLMSLSEFMTKQAVMRILKLKLEKGGYIKEVKDLETLPEFQTKTSGGFTLFKELAGEGTDVSGGRIKTKGDVYRIIGVGIIGKVTRKINCLYDLANDQLLFYSED